MKQTTLYLLLLLLLLAGCRRGPGLNIDELPTPALPEALATALILTQNAPPQGFDTVSFPQISANLSRLPGWHATLLVEFRGSFAGTPRETEASTTLEVWYNQVASARRVRISTDGDLLGLEEPSRYEAVRLGEDVFLVLDGVCVTDAGEDAAAAADLNAAGVIGGVRQATAAGQRAVINGQQVWRYSFVPDDLLLPLVDRGDAGRITALSSELWVAPEHNAVIRYYVTMDVEGASVFRSTLPVTGTLIIRYEVFDIGIVPNISVPFGC